VGTLLGITLIALGGLSSAAFYLPLKYIRNWSWESGWLVYVVVAFFLAPWAIACLTIPNLFGLIYDAPPESTLLPLILGIGYGAGGLTWGLSIRYLGIGLGNVIPLGTSLLLSTFIGPLVPLFIDSNLRPEGLNLATAHKVGEMFAGERGDLLLASVLCSLLGIILCAWAAKRKDQDQRGLDNERHKDFNLGKGLVMGLIGGFLSSFFTFGEYAGGALTQSITASDPGTIWSYNAVYALILLGGFGLNLAYCIGKLSQNKSFGEYRSLNAPLSKNFILGILAGCIWISMFIFKGMGTVQIPESLEFITWSLLFTFLIVFSNLLGLITKEWVGTKHKTLTILIIGLSILVLAAILIGITGTY